MGNSGTSYVKASCVLPGTKRREQEPVAKAVHRVLDEDLQEIVSILHVASGKSQEQTVELKYSATHGIRTRYLRTIISCWLSEPYSFSCTTIASQNFLEIFLAHEENP